MTDDELPGMELIRRRAEGLASESGPFGAAFVALESDSFQLA